MGRPGGLTDFPCELRCPQAPFRDCKQADSGEPSRFEHFRMPAARKAPLHGKRTKFCIREFSLTLFPNPKPLILFIVQCG